MKALSLAMTAASLILSAAVSPAPALSQPATDPAEAERVARRVEELSQEGVDAFREGRHREALARFKAALALQPVANLLYNIARTHEALGEKGEALTYYERFTRAPDATPDAQEKARSRVSEIRAELEAERRAEQDRATAQLRPVAPAEVLPGTTTVTAGQSSDVLEVTGWVAAGLGAALVVAGGTFVGLAASEQARFSATDRLSDKRLHRDRAEDYALAGDIGLGVGIAALGAGVALLIVDATSDDGVASVPGSSGLSVAPAVGGDALGVVASLRW